MKMLTIDSLKTLIFGTPFPTSREAHERLDKVRALAVFASDPISSNAYATEAVMSVLILLGTGGLHLTLPVAIGVAVLVLMVAFSYIQTILHYPSGGGAYIVAKDNLGEKAGLIAAAALLTDYVLTVSVSVSAGIRAITSAFPEVHQFRVEMAVVAILLIAWINLRGVRESGSIFAIPTYAFVVSVLLVIGLGLVRFFGFFGLPPLESHPVVVQPTDVLTQFGLVWLVMRAFAGGCTALTGIEAISNGVQAFKKPESKNAATTMFAMAAIAMTLFMGISFLSTQLKLVPHEQVSILSQLTELVVGKGLLYYFVQMSTMFILILAANTGFQDFPRLSSFLAHDGYAPRWLANRGDRLVYSYGIVTLTAISILLVILFKAEEIAMLPLYAIGVFIAFTLSQTGMVKLMSKVGKLKPSEELNTGATIIHWERGWRWKRAVNAFGASTTSVVLVVLIATKFAEGAWMIVLTIPLIVLVFTKIKKHYSELADALRLNGNKVESRRIANVALVPIGDVHNGTLKAIQYARLIADDVRAICVSVNPEETKRVRDLWDRHVGEQQGVKLEIVEYDFRDVISPLVEFIEQVHDHEFPDEYITVVLPEFVSRKWWTKWLHNRHAEFLRHRLSMYDEKLVIIDIPFGVESHCPRQNMI